MKNKTLLLFAVIILSGTQLIACGGKSQPDPTLEAKIETFSKTATVRANQQGETGYAVQTAQVEATARSQSMSATEIAGSDLEEAASKATAVAAAPILAEIPLYGVDENLGRVGWIHPPVTLELDEFRSGEFVNQFTNVIAKDFVIAADITWDTQYGTSGCGFIVRSDGDEVAPDQYLVIASRHGTGHVYFAALADGNPANYTNLYANGIDPAFEWQNGTTNRLAVVGRDNILSVYTNYTLIGEIDTTEPPPPIPDLPAPPIKPARPQRPVKPGGMDSEAFEEAMAEFDKAMEAYEDELEEYQKKKDEHEILVLEIKNTHQAALKTYYETDSVFKEGFTGMFAFAYSGYTKCRFDDAWLWLIEE